MLLKRKKKKQTMASSLFPLYLIFSNRTMLKCKGTFSRLTKAHSEIKQSCEIYIVMPTISIGVESLGKISTDAN